MGIAPIITLPEVFPTDQNERLASVAYIKDSSDIWQPWDKSVHNMIWNTNTLAWEKATGSLTGGGNVTVTNFPASYPVTDNGGSLTIDGNVGIIDTHGHWANVQAVTGSISGDEYGLVTNSIIHGKSTAGGGAWVDVKVNPSGSLQVGGAVGITDSTGTYIAQVGAREQTPTGNALQVQIGAGDVISNLPVTVDYPHHQVHEGEAYTYCNLQTGGLNSGSNYDVRISVPTLTATIRTPHMVFEFISDGTAEVYLHRGVTWTSGGTDDSSKIFNKNHNSTNTANTKIYITGATALTVNSTGTVTKCWYTTASKSSTGQGDRSLEESVLKSNTEYMLRITSRTASMKFLIRLSFYEDLGV